MTYVTLNGMIYLTKLISCGYLVPEDEDNREYWTYKPTGALPWFIRAATAPKDFFRPESKSSFHLGNGDASSLQSVSGMSRAVSPRQEKEMEAAIIDAGRQNSGFI